ncbi:MAG: TIGR02996 domain-containing protein [Deltaproteobacteria bacterium]
MSLDALFAEIVAHPDDDGPRLVWADAIGGERGELVALQCDLARGGASLADASARRARVRELVHAHGAAWAQLAGIAKLVEFRRGFVVAAELDLASAIDHNDHIVEVAPLLRAITLPRRGFVGAESSGPEASDQVAQLERLFDIPLYAQLSAVAFGTVGRYARGEDEDDLHEWQSHAESVIARAVQRDAFARLTGFGWDELTTHAVHVLVASRTLARVVRLQLSGRIGVDAWCAALRSAPRLRALDLGRTQLAPELLAEIPASVTELHVQGLNAAKLAALAEAPIAAHVERLFLNDGTLPDPRPLARFTRLRALEYDGIWFGGPEYSQSQADAIDALIALELPALRELHLGMLSRAAVAKIAQRLGPQLELLDARGCEAHLPLPTGVRELVAGDLWHPGWGPSFPLFDAGITDGPAWDPPPLEVFATLDE